MTSQKIYSFPVVMGNIYFNNYVLCCLNNLATEEFYNALSFIKNLSFFKLIKNVYVNILYSFGVRFNTNKKIFV